VGGGAAGVGRLPSGAAGIDAARMPDHFFDTADVVWRAQRDSGQAIAGAGSIRVATKIGWVGYDGKNGRSQYDTDN